MTERNFEAANIGEQLGTEGVGTLITQVEAYCACEEKRIVLTNEPHLVALRAEAASLMDEEREIVVKLRLAPPAGDLRTRHRRAVYYGIVTGILAIAGLVFSLYALDPFRLGIKGYLYCLAIGILEPFLLEYVLEPWHGKTVAKSLATFACVAGLLSLVLLAVIRGDRLAEEMKSSAPVIVFDDAQPQPAQQPENSFYEKTTPLLQLVMILLAIAMELGAGFALHEVWQLTSDVKEDWAKLRKQLREIRERLEGLAFQISTLQTEPQLFSTRFWRNFYRAMLTRTVKSAVTKLLVLVLAAFFAMHGVAVAQTSSTWVIAVDLTQSVGVRGPDGKSEFQKNIEAVSKLLAQIPADSRVTVIGITDHSFAQPYILLSATIPPDAGYFGERLNAARRQLFLTWKARSARLQPKYRRTDIFGAIALAAEMFHSTMSGHKTLIIYSDMQDTAGNGAVPFRISDSSQGRTPDVPSLRMVTIYILGAEGTGTSLTYWDNLREFWGRYFAATEGSMKTFSVLRIFLVDQPPLP